MKPKFANVIITLVVHLGLWGGIAIGAMDYKFTDSIMMGFIFGAGFFVAISCGLGLEVLQRRLLPEEYRKYNQHQTSLDCYEKSQNNGSIKIE